MTQWLGFPRAGGSREEGRSQAVLDELARNHTPSFLQYASDDPDQPCPQGKALCLKVLALSRDFTGLPAGYHTQRHTSFSNDTTDKCS